MTKTGLPPRFAGGRFEGPPPLTRLSVDPTALERPLAGLPGVGKVTARRLAGFGLTTVGDLIDHFPRRYEDFRDRKDVRDLRLGEEATVRGVVERVSADRTARKRVTVVRAVVRDGTGAIEATWFNQGYLTRVLEPGVTVSVRGTFRPQGGRATFLVRSHEILGEEDGETVHTEGLVPVYPASEQVSARLLRAVMQGVRGDMRRLADPLPSRLRVRERLPGRADATLAVHQPRTPAEAKQARERLVLEELLLMQVGLLLHKRRQQERVSAQALRRTGRAERRLPRGPSVRAHRAPARRARGDRDRLADGPADAAAAAGRRRVGQDGGRPVLPAACRRIRSAGGADGAHRDARRPARRDGGGARRRASPRSSC